MQVGLRECDADLGPRFALALCALGSEGWKELLTLASDSTKNKRLRDIAKQGSSDPVEDNMEESQKGEDEEASLHKDLVTLGDSFLPMLRKGIKVHLDGQVCSHHPPCPPPSSTLEDLF